MQFRELPLPGCLEVLPRIAGDARGRFVKPFHEGLFAERGLETHLAEVYHSSSIGGVVRGLHFQTPPADHAKLVTCVAGACWDVALDLRRGSPTYGQHAGLELSAETGTAVYLPRGVAHGFCTPNGEATLLYAVGTVHAPAHDTGVRWDSAGIDWPVGDPIVSERDRGFVALDEFRSPFTFDGDPDG